MSKDSAEPGSTRTKQPSRQGAAAHEPTLHAAHGKTASGARISSGEGVHERQAEGGTDPWLGSVVEGRYRIEEKLGEGGMGVVYIAEHVRLKKKVAFKVIHPELAAHEELLLRFTREALATGQLDHAHICSAIDFDRMDDGSAYLVMPFVRGLSLQAALDAGSTMAWRQACTYGAQIADALSAAHALGIVHRDLKPDNVLVEERADGSRAAKVLDFGVASLTGASESISSDTAKPLTQAGTVLGTPGYMSPEQATAGAVDHRTDLYALGVILWELTAGKRLFSGPNVTEIFAKQFSSVPEPLGLSETGPAREFSELVARLLEPRKEDRPDSAADVREALRRLTALPEPHAAQATWERSTRLATRQLGGLYEKSQTTWSQLSSEGLNHWHRATPRARTAVAGSLGILLLLGLFSMWGGDDAAQKGRPSRAQKAQARKSEPSRRDEAEKPGPKAPSLVEAVENLLDGLPEELGTARKTLYKNTNRRARAKAAKAVLGYQGKAEVPPYLTLMAKLERARGCRGKRKILLELVELGDKNAHPFVQRLDQTPPRGCSLFGARDCLACMRGDIEEALEALD